MKEDLKQSRNLARNVVQSIYVSTAVWPTIIMAAGGWVDTFETFIWEFDPETKQRGKLRKQYYHRTESEALKFHSRFCELYTLVKHR